MANHKSAEKRNRSSETKRNQNRYKAKTVRTTLRKVQTTADASEASKALPDIISKVDKLAKTGVIHKNKAANLKSKLMKKIKPAGKNQ
jgi:small subunit ribosomal protein S20